MSLFHTDSHVSDEDAFRRAVAHAVSLAKEAGHNTIRIAVGTNTMFRIGLFNDVYGTEFVQDVASGNGGKQHGCTFLLMTKKKTPTAPADSPIIALHADPHWLIGLIANRGDAPLIYLPWHENELTSYRYAHPDSQEV